MTTTTAQGTPPVPAAEQPAFPFDAEVTIVKCHDHTDKPRSFNAKSKGGKNILVFYPDKGDGSYLPLIQEDDTVKVSVREPARTGGLIANLLPRDKQPRNIQNEFRRHEQRLTTGTELNRSDIELPPKYAEALRYVRRAVGDPDTKTYASRIVMAHLGPVVAALKAEGKS